MHLVADMLARVGPVKPGHQQQGMLVEEPALVQAEWSAVLHDQQPAVVTTAQRSGPLLERRDDEQIALALALGGTCAAFSHRVGPYHRANLVLVSTDLWRGH